MASENVRQKLKQLLERVSNKDTFSEDIKWLQSINSWINFHCPTYKLLLWKMSFVLLTGDGCSSELNELKEDNASDDSEESVLSSIVHQLSCVK